MSHIDSRLHRRLIAIAGAILVAVAMAMPAPLYADTAADLASARKELEEIGRASAEISSELGHLTGQLEKTRAEIDQTKAEIADRQQSLSSYISSEYKLGFTDLIDLVMGADSFDDLISRIFYMNKVAQIQAKTILEVKDLQDDLAKKQEQQERNVEQTQRQVEQLNAQRDQAASLVNSLDAKLQDELRAEAEENEDLQAGLNAGSSQAAPNQTAPEANRPSEPEQGGEDPEPAPDPEPQPEPEPEPEKPSKPQKPEKPEGGNPPTVVGGGSIVSRAQGKLGSAYVWGAAGPDAFDCSGLVSYAITGKYVHYWSTYDIMNWPTVNDPQPGDIAVSWTHTGIYIGGGQMIHASNPSTGVITGPVQSGMKFVRYPG